MLSFSINEVDIFNSFNKYGFVYLTSKDTASVKVNDITQLLNPKLVEGCSNLENLNQ